MQGDGMSRCTRAFTLIELLVVIGIMALLIGMVMPGLAHARTASKATLCASNAHQLGTLFLDQSWERDLTPRSAYDLDRPRFKTVASVDDLGYNGLNQGEVEPPRSTGGFAQRLHVDELTSPAQPPSWKIPCPEAINASEQSYGLNWRHRLRKPDRLSDRDPVLVGSAFRIIARGADLRPRHDSDRATFWFGDGHVDLKDASFVPTDDLTRKLWRDDPLKAIYADN
jgi:prepilin-type N-terminal cleavage/methylation domain-containing protein/prepilin-type processing-associated H-X9-DG protein